MKKNRKKILIKTLISTIIVSIIYFLMLRYKNVDRDVLTFSIVPVSFFIFSYFSNIFLDRYGF